MIQTIDEALELALIESLIYYHIYILKMALALRFEKYAYNTIIINFSINVISNKS